MNPTPPNQENDDQDQESYQDGSPKFGRLLLILLAAVGLIVFITFASEAYYT